MAVLHFVCECMGVIACVGDGCRMQFEAPDTPAQAEISDLFYVHKHTKCPLSAIDALALLVHIVENPDGGASINLGKLQQKKDITVRGS
jgi:hypothetical protein